MASTFQVVDCGQHVHPSEQPAQDLHNAHAAMPTLVACEHQSAGPPISLEDNYIYSKNAIQKNIQKIYIFKKHYYLYISSEPRRAASGDEHAW